MKASSPRSECSVTVAAAVVNGVPLGFSRLATIVTGLYRWIVVFGDCDAVSYHSTVELGGTSSGEVR